MKILAIIMSIGLILGLTGCGGGSSSSGGGGAAAASAYAGSYGGTYNLSLSGPGGTFGATGPISMVVNNDGSVVIDPDSSSPSKGSISGKNVSVNVPASEFNSDGVSCSGTFVITATENGGGFSGKFGPGGVRCNGVPISYSGTFSVSKFAKSHAGGSRIGEFLREAVAAGG